MDLDKEELESTRNIGKTADETENEIEKIIQFMINDNYNISFISSIRSLMALYKTYLSLYNKETEKNKELKILIEQNLKYSHNLEKDLFENCSNYVVSKDKIRKKISVLEKIQSEFTNNEELRIKIITLKDLLLEEE